MLNSFQPLSDILELTEFNVEFMELSKFMVGYSAKWKRFSAEDQKRWDISSSHGGCSARLKILN